MSVMSTGRRPGAVVRRLSPEDTYSLPRRPGPPGGKSAGPRRPGRPRLHLVPPLPAGQAEDRPAAPPRGRTPVPADARVPAPRAASVLPAPVAQAAPRAAATAHAQDAAHARVRAQGGVAAPARVRAQGGVAAPARVRAQGRAARPGDAPAHSVRPASAPAGRGRARPKVRLTRRGRLVIWVLAALAAAAALIPVWLIAATGAQAANHGLPPGAVHAGMRHVVVRPGQTLWSIAMAAEPVADPRLVTQEIMQVNALSSQILVPGESLWVPAN